MSNDVPEGNCSFCGGPISDVRAELHWHGRDGSWGVGFAGICQPCDIDYGIGCINGKFEEWRATAPDPSHLISIAEEAELEKVSRRFHRYPHHGGQWQAFLTRRREGDVIWRTQHGFAMVRNGRPVSGFGLPRPL
jgi:hypothetical protein